MAPRSPSIRAPMRAVSGRLPLGDGWGYEIKWDGMRLLADVGPGDRVRLRSSRGNVVTRRFPELGALRSGVLAASATLDGELVAFDDRGRPSFGRLQRRIHIDDPGAAAAAAAEVPVALVVFDLLELDGNDITGLPLTERRRALEAVVEPGPSWRLSQLHIGGGTELLDAVREAGLEGVVAKRLDGSYAAGRRSPSWVKTKIRRRQEFVVGGWAPGLGSTTGRLGALLVGYYDDGSLRFAGRVGSGLTQDDLAELPGLLGPDRAASPFDPPPDQTGASGPHWVEPQMVVEVAFAEWSADARLRHPSFLGRHPDRDPRTVLREPLADPDEQHRSDPSGARDWPT